MDRSTRKRNTRPLLTPSRSSHARMQFAGFGCGAPPPRRKNLPKAERSKVLLDAEKLVRGMAAKDEGKDGEADSKLAPQNNTTSDKYKFMLEKPWRTGHAFHDEDEPSNSNVKERIEEFKTKDPKSFATEAEVPTRNIRGGKGAQNASIDMEEEYDDLVPSNTSLGFHEEIIDYTENLKETHDETTLLKDAMNQLKKDHEAELKRVVDEQAKLVQSAQAALEQAHLSARVKVSSLERKLADVTKQETQRQDAEAALRSKSDMIENQLAKVELDRRMEVSSLRKKLANAEDRVTEMNERVVSIEESEQRLESMLEQREEQYRRRETSLETDLQRLRDENDQMERHFFALKKDHEALTNKLDDQDVNHANLLEGQNADLAVKLSKLKEEADSAEARHMEALDKALEEKAGFADQIDILRKERERLLSQIDELNASSIGLNNRSSTESDEPSAAAHPAKTGELWERLSTAESKLELEQSKYLRLQQENSVLTEKLSVLNERNRGLSENEANAKMKDTIESLEKQIASTSEDLYEAKSKYAELVLQNQQIQDQLKEQEHSFNAKSVKKDIEISDMRSNVKVLEKLLEGTRQNLEIAEEKGRQLNHIEREFESKERQLCNMTDEHEQLERDFDKLCEKEAMTSKELNEANERHRNEVDELEAEIRRSNVCIDDLQREVSTLIPVSKEVGRVKMSLHDTEEKLELSKSENKSLNQQITELQSEISSLNSKVRELELDLDHANRRNEETTSHLLNLEAAQAKEQEVLSEELRDSETTIACLMEEIDQLKYIAGDLEHTKGELQKTREENLALERSLEEAHETKERELRTLQSKLNDTNQEVDELRDQLLPMTKELQQTTREIEDLQYQLQRNGDGGESEALRLFEEENATLRRELKVSAAALEMSENQLAAFSQDKEKEFQEVNHQIGRSRETIIHLQSEVNLLKPKVLLFDRKEQECESLAGELAAKEKQIDMCRLQLQDMEEERNYSRARIAELDQLVNRSGCSDSVMADKANEVARLKAERDTLRQKLTVVEAFATALEEDNNQKKQLVNEMMSKSGDVGGLSTAGMIESLQKDLERTLKRCADLSLKLADSQFHIDQLTEEVRRSKKNMDNSSHRGFRRSGSYDSPSRTVSRKSITSMFANSISAMDESLRGVSAHGKQNLP